MYTFILKYLPVMFEAINLYCKHKKTVLLILVYIFISCIVSNVNLYIFEKRIRLQTISEAKRIDTIMMTIDEVLKQLGPNSFVSWLIVEERKDGYMLYFKDVRGIVPNGDKPISIKYLNKTYLEEIKLDKNGTYLLNALEEFEIRTITKQECLEQGYTTLFKILNRTNIHLDSIKITPVKKSDKVIWIFTLFSNSTSVSEPMKNNNLRGIAMQAKKEILDTKW